MFDPLYEEEMAAEFNAQFDDVRERFAAEILDAEHEDYCDYCQHAEDEGVEPEPFDVWKSRFRKTWPQPVDYGADEIPF